MICRGRHTSLPLPYIAPQMSDVNISGNILLQMHARVCVCVCVSVCMNEYVFLCVALPDLATVTSNIMCVSFPL